ncbi:MAG: Gfo/Idh/MocA family oxidoreductase [Gemmataceae bacterium]|nr:Gfo/Idh/MocA family oxidoreductase [Gemmataceae bacterium]
MTDPTRRDFVAASAAALPGWSALHAAGNGRLRVGLVGCGDRGTGAAANALAADPDVALTAVGDVFADRIASCLDALTGKPTVGAKVAVPKDHRFVGFDAYKQVIDRCDVVLLCTPPHFRPLHLTAAVAAGRHVFAEKPVAVDAPGVRAVLAAGDEAGRRGLSVVSGLCLRYDAGFRETVRRVHDGAVGEPVTLFATDLRSGRWTKPRQPGQTDMQYQMRNWYNFAWLSGDFNVEQHVHFLDVCAWLMKEEYPVRAVGTGGRAVLTGPDSGNIYDHFAVVYEYKDGATLVSHCRQQPGCKNDMSVRVAGRKGRALLAERTDGLVIRGDGGTWSYDGPGNQMYQAEHDALFAAVRAGKPVNNGGYMARSTLLAIMGRMAAYTGRQVTWEAALNSAEDLSPPRYGWDVPLPEPPAAVPGRTKFR